MRKHLPPKEFFIGKEIPGNESYKIVEYIGSGMNAHVFKAYSEKLKHFWACKIIPRANILEGTDWVVEAQKPNSLTSPVVVQTPYAFEWKDDNNGDAIDCVGFCSQYIDGVSLKKFIATNKGKVPLHFIESVLSSILRLVFETDKKGLPHGDLHSGNVIVENQNEFNLDPSPSIRVIDFGIGSVDRMPKDDFDQTAVILKELLENVDYSVSSPRDKYAFNVLNDHFLAHLCERDMTRDFLARRPKELYEKLRSITNSFSTEQANSERIQLITPFDYLSCEQIGESHSLLKTLYSNLFLGLNLIEGANNLILTGPRGCGKSTVFKSLSLKHRLYVPENDTSDIQYVGVYYRCDDLYYAFPRYQAPTAPQAIDLPVHFLTATLISETLECLKNWSLKHFRSEFERIEPSLSEKIWSLLELGRSGLSSDNSIAALCERLRRERRRAIEKQRLVHDENVSWAGHYFAPNILSSFCALLQQELYFLKGRPFYFFIDDYSAPKITLPLQENLNRLLMSRSGSCFFKTSTESCVSYAKSDVDGKGYIEGREFILTDLGLVFISENSEKKLAFLEDVFSRRLNAVTDFPANNLDELVGPSPPTSQNEIARKIRNKEKIVWHGKEALTEICSGDIHYVINLVGKMVAAVGGPDGLRAISTLPKVEPAVQNRAIRTEAGFFLSNLQTTFKDGRALVDVVTAFGNIVHSHLLYKNSKNESGDPPLQASRIEPYEDPKLSDPAQKIYNELLRYSIFLEDKRGKSRRGNVVPRLYLRRFLIPHFNLTFNKRDPLGMETADLEALLLKPMDFSKAKSLKEFEGAETGNSQVNLFSADEEG